MAMSNDHLMIAPPPVTRRAMIEAVLAAGAASLALAASRAPARAQGTPAAAQPGRPNAFQLTGDNADIQYFSGDSSLMGMPKLTFTYPEGEVSATGDDIEVQPIVTGGWPFGTLVSMYVDAAPDAWARSVTLVLPGINLIDGEETAFTTFAVVARHLTNIGGPAFVQGQLQEYEVIPLKGTARATLS